MAKAAFLSFLPGSGRGNRSESGLKPVIDSLGPLPLLKNFEDSGRGWFWSTAGDGRLTYLSASVLSTLKGAQGDLKDIALIDLFAPSPAETAVRERLPFLVNKRSTFEKITLQVAGAHDRWWEVSGSPVYDESGEFSGYRGFCVDVTEQLQTSDAASQLAMYDTLTGLPNRLSMARALEASIALLGRPSACCAVMMIDLDRFKQINDSLGHPAGDELLKMVASRLIKIIGDREKIFRLGGDEFQLILPGVEDRGRLGEIAQEIISSLSQPYSIDGNRCVIGASIGLAVAPFDGGTSEAVVRNADLALYAAKGNGRGCFRFFANALLETAADRRELESDLRDALANDQLSVFYQPVVSASTHYVTGVEALVRWTHPKRGAISPAVFIPIAEDANLIVPLGEWVMRKACEDAARWPESIRVAVNVSPVQFANEALPALVMSALANSGLPPSRLELELTEGVFLSESAETDTMFSNLKDIGVRLALDDFGTGYSSLGYLKTAPFDKIKIDQSFVRGATLPGSRNGAIIAAIVALASALDMETTAEGIESLDQLDLMRELGVSHIQGYVYSKPIPDEELRSQLEQGRWTLRPTGPARLRSERRSIYRKAGAIIGSSYFAIIIRNLSDTGCFVEGLDDAAEGTQMIVDFGECQMEVATVVRAEKKGHGLVFGQPLVSDGVGGVCTNRRVSPYGLAQLGLSPNDYQGSSRTWSGGAPMPFQQLSDILGLKVPPPSQWQIHAGTDQSWGGSFSDDKPQPNPAAASGHGVEASKVPAHLRVRQFLVAANPLQSLSLAKAGKNGDLQVSAEEWEKLKSAVESSHNSQLKYIIALVVITGVRLHELIGAQWIDINLETRNWKIRAAGSNAARTISLSDAAMEIIGQLPRWDECDHLIANPRTKKPYNSFYGSWDAARRKAGLDHLSIHELRNSIRQTW